MRVRGDLLSLFRRVQVQFLVALGLSLVTIVAGIGLLGLSGWFLTAAALTTLGAAFNLFGPSAGVRGLSFLRILSRYFEKLTGHDATLRLLSDLRSWLFERLFRILPLPRRLTRGDLASRLGADLDALDAILLVALGPLLGSVLTAIGVTVLLAFFLPGAVPAYVACSMVMTLGVPPLLVTASRRAGRAAIAASSDLRAALLESVDGHADLVLLGAIDEAATRIERATNELARTTRRLARAGAVASGAVQALAAAIILGVMLAGMSALQAGTIEGPLLVGLVLAVLASFEPMMILVRSSTRLAASMAAAERLQSLAETTSTIASPAVVLPLPEVFDICFDHVTFSHDGRAIVLDDVSFEVAQGECVALRGASGAGKSTIAHLLLRLVDPVTGAIRIGGRDIRALDLGGLRKVLALMTQDAPLFSDTIRNNLTIGRADASEAELWDMLAKVNLDDTVRQLPSGLDTIVGEAGRTLSAGQARRVALARTLLSPAPIIVLDEPTDGLDREAEDAFLRSLPRIALGRTLVVITHAEVPSAFRVLELRAGRMTEASDGLQVMPYQSLS